MSDDPHLNHEEKAIDALITGALHVWLPKEISEAEINEFLSELPDLSDFERAALSKIQQLYSSEAGSAKTFDRNFMKPELESSCMAMNRENSKNELPAEARQEIEKKRETLIAQLKARKQSTG